MSASGMPNPAPGTLPETQVRAMFDRIARVYDLMNSVMTAGMHHRWRERAADLARVGPGSRALDVATGTGDLAIELASRGAEVTGLDFSEQMLELALRKSPGLDWVQGDALALPYGDGEFDAVTVGFGARNFSDLDRGLREMARVTRPGGRVVVLEITTPQKPPLSWFFRVWFDRVVPALGRVAGDPDAYTYLPSSVRRFPGPQELAGRMAGAGLTDVRWTLTAGGKRLRPVLVFLCAAEPSDPLVPAAVAVELLHMATLVHDDVLDGADLRRGRPTVFAQGGRAAATATGDLLFSRAFAELAATGSEDAVRALSKASSALARGELMQQEDAWSPDVCEARYLERCRLKTASLFEASCRLG